MNLYGARLIGHALRLADPPAARCADRGWSIVGCAFRWHAGPKVQLHLSLIGPEFSAAYVRHAVAEHLACVR